MKESVLTVSIAFNAPEMIKHQIALMGKFYSDPYEMIIVDNSDLPKAEAAIKNTCLSSGIKYERSPAAWNRGSESHGNCLNWVLKNIVIPSDYRYFAFMDHDIFPIRKVKMLETVRLHGLFGVPQAWTKNWYLWPGLVFFDREMINKFCQEELLDFRPVPEKWDTGGSMWLQLYSKIPMESIPKVFMKRHAVRDRMDSPQLDSYETINDDWMHVLNGSMWMPSRPGEAPKNILMDKIISKYENGEQP